MYLTIQGRIELFNSYLLLKENCEEVVMFKLIDDILVVQDSMDISVFCKQNHIAKRDFNIPVEVMNGTTSCAYLLHDCEKYNQYTVIPETVTDCTGMFWDCTAFNQPIVLPPNLVSASKMFMECKAFNQPIVLPSTLRNCSEMFSGCRSFNQYIFLPESAFLDKIFLACAELHKPMVLPEPGGIPDIPLPKLIDMYKNMFRFCQGDLDLRTFIYSVHDV